MADLIHSQGIATEGFFNNLGHFSQEMWESTSKSVGPASSM